MNEHHAPHPQASSPSLAALLRRANHLSRAADLDELMDRTLEWVLEAAGAESDFLYLFDPSGEELIFSGVRGVFESQSLMGLRLKKALWSIDFTQSGPLPILIADIAQEPVLLPSVHAHNGLILPLTLEGAPLGMIQVFNYQAAELELLPAIAERFVSEAERRVTLENTRRSNRRLQTLIDMIGEVSGTLDRGQLLEIIPEQAARLTQAERSSLFLIDSGTKELGYQASFQTPMEPQAIEQGSPRAQFLAQILHYIQTGRTPRRGLDGFEFSSRSVITVPLYESGSLSQATMGGLTVLNKPGQPFDPEDMQLLNILARQTSTFLQTAGLYENMNDLFLDVIKALVAAIDAKDRYTQGHSVRVLDYALAIARELHLDAATISDVRIGSLLHDVGKIGISDGILSKPGKLTPEETVVIKKHPLFGRQIMSQVRILQSALPGISEHHERLDGSGYPYGLMGEQISIVGRVIAVADVFDAMTTDRPYRRAISVPETLEHLSQNRGRLYDSDCVRALLLVVEKNLAMSEEFDFDERNGNGRIPSPFLQGFSVQG